MNKRLWTVLLLLVAMVLPLAAKDKEYLDGVVLDEQRQKWASRTDAFNAAMAGRDTRGWVFMVQVGDVTYAGVLPKGWIGSYKPKAEDWPPNTPVKVRFEKKGAFGIKQTFIYVVRPGTKKEMELEVKSMIDKDGKELCGKHLCG